jgi:hypothetical protein
MRGINHKLCCMKKIMINGYAYWYNEITNKLFLDESGKQEIDRKFLTKNERLQLDNAINYKQPMISFY